MAAWRSLPVNRAIAPLSCRLFSLTQSLLISDAAKNQVVRTLRTMSGASSPEALTDDYHARPGRPRPLKAKADVHHEAMGNIRGPYGMASRADWDVVHAALGRGFTPVPDLAFRCTTRYHRSLALVFLHSRVLVNCADAERRKAENHEAMGSVSGPCGMASRTDWDGANAALGNVLRQCQNRRS